MVIYLPSKLPEEFDAEKVIELDGKVHGEERYLNYLPDQSCGDTVDRMAKLDLEPGLKPYMVTNPMLFKEYHDKGYIKLTNNSRSCHFGTATFVWANAIPRTLKDQVRKLLMD